MMIMAWKNWSKLDTWIWSHHLAARYWACGLDYLAHAARPHSEEHTVSEAHCSPVLLIRCNTKLSVKIATVELGDDRRVVGLWCQATSSA